MKVIPMRYSNGKLGLIIIGPKVAGLPPYSRKYTEKSITFSLPFFRLTYVYRALSNLEKLDRKIEKEIRRERIREAKNFRIAR